MAYFHDFQTYYKPHSYSRNSLYKKAVDEAIMEAAKRSRQLPVFVGMFGLVQIIYWRTLKYDKAHSCFLLK